MTFAQCAFGAPWQKWTTIMWSVELAVGAIARFGAHGCTHETHVAHAHGRDDGGLSRAAE